LLVALDSVCRFKNDRRAAETTMREVREVMGIRKNA